LKRIALHLRAHAALQRNCPAQRISTRRNELSRLHLVLVMISNLELQRQYHSHSHVCNRGWDYGQERTESNSAGSIPAQLPTGLNADHESDNHHHDKEWKNEVEIFQIFHLGDTFERKGAFLLPQVSLRRK